MNHYYYYYYHQMTHPVACYKLVIDQFLTIMVLTSCIQLLFTNYDPVNESSIAQH